MCIWVSVFFEVLVKLCYSCKMLCSALDHEDHAISISIEYTGLSSKSFIFRGERIQVGSMFSWDLNIHIGWGWLWHLSTGISPNLKHTLIHCYTDIAYNLHCWRISLPASRGLIFNSFNILGVFVQMITGKALILLPACMSFRHNYRRTSKWAKK